MWWDGVMRVYVHASWRNRWVDGRIVGSVSGYFLVKKRSEERVTRRTKKIRYDEIATSHNIRVYNCQYAEGVSICCTNIDSDRV